MTTFEYVQVAGTLIAVITSVVAIVFTAITYKKQVNLALLEKRLSAWLSLVQASDYFLRIETEMVSDSWQWRENLNRPSEAVIVFQSLFGKDVSIQVDLFWREVVKFGVIVETMSVGSRETLRIPDESRKQVSDMCAQIRLKRNSLNSVLVERYFSKCA